MRFGNNDLFQKRIFERFTINDDLKNICYFTAIKDAVPQTDAIINPRIKLVDSEKCPDSHGIEPFGRTIAS